MDKAPVSIFERYFNKEYGEKRQWRKVRGGGGVERTGLLPYNCHGTKEIGLDWNDDQSSHACTYYNEAENTTEIFWGRNSLFKRYFDQLDLAYVTEIACGHGRHVPHYLKKAGRIFLVDINESNISFCRKRFPHQEKISFIKNTGNDLKDVETGSQTSVFSYDAMIHFELLDILEYLRESCRVLRPGGKILFHHSNMDFFPELSCVQKPVWHNFMSADIFAYLATRTGFRVLAQTVFPWGHGREFYPNAGCLSLCEK